MRLMAWHGSTIIIIAVTSSPAGPVLAGLVFDILAFKTAHVQTIRNQVKNYIVITGTLQSST